MARYRKDSIPVMDVGSAGWPPARNDGLQVQGTALWVGDSHVHNLHAHGGHTMGGLKVVASHSALDTIGA